MNNLHFSQAKTIFLLIFSSDFKIYLKTYAMKPNSTSGYQLVSRIVHSEALVRQIVETICWKTKNIWSLTNHICVHCSGPEAAKSTIKEPCWCQYRSLAFRNHPITSAEVVKIKESTKPQKISFATALKSNDRICEDGEFQKTKQLRKNHQMVQKSK